MERALLKLQPIDPAVQARLALYEDFALYAKHCLKIRTKPTDACPFARIENFKLNEAQRRLLELIDSQMRRRGSVRIIILKGRQMGLSTAVGGWLYWWTSQRHAQKTLVVAHKAEATQTLFDMTRRFHEQMPELLKPTTKYSSRKELVFDQLDSAYTVVTAGGDSIGRSETITAAHLSEIAFWPKSIAKENFSGLMDTVPSTPGTAVFIESTANGMSGVFYDQWKAAKSGKSDFEPIFLPWFIDPDYRKEVPADFERSPQEQVLVERFGLDDAQLMYRRIRIAEKGEELFKQEYPCDAEEAFLTSGRPVFHPERLAEMMLGKREPIVRKALEGDEWQEHPLGELLCYLPHDPKATYYIGADVGGGIQKDYSVAQVFDGNRRQVAVWRSDRFDPEYFGTVLARLGNLYNDARIICEANNMGRSTNRVLTKDEAYWNYYTERVYDKIADTERTTVGFTTSEKSKTFVINGLRTHVRDRKIEICDEATLEELRSYIVTETGRMEAEKGCHDDTVIALALCDHINEGAFTPITNMDDWYVNIE